MVGTPPVRVETDRRSGESRQTALVDSTAHRRLILTHHAAGHWAPARTERSSVCGNAGRYRHRRTRRRPTSRRRIPRCRTPRCPARTVRRLGETPVARRLPLRSGLDRRHRPPGEDRRPGGTGLRARYGGGRCPGHPPGSAGPVGRRGGRTSRPGRDRTRAARAARRNSEVTRVPRPVHSRYGRLSSCRSRVRNDSPNSERASLTSCRRSRSV